MGSSAPDSQAGLADIKQRLRVKDLATELRRGIAAETISSQQQLEMALALADGPRAIALAERAADLTGGEVARVLDTLASAYATGGRFADAVSTAHRAQQLAAGSGDQDLAMDIEQRIRIYTRGESYRAARLPGGPPAEDTPETDDAVEVRVGTPGAPIEDDPQDD